MGPNMTTKIENFSDFYPFYLSEHQNGTCRFLHLVGSLSVLTIIGVAIAVGTPWLGLACPFAGYGPAWVGHFVFEKNRPASFKQPLFSFMGDWVMLKDMLTARVPIFGTIPSELMIGSAPQEEQALEA